MWNLRADGRANTAAPAARLRPDGPGKTVPIGSEGQSVVVRATGQGDTYNIVVA